MSKVQNTHQNALYIQLSLNYNGAGLVLLVNGLFSEIEQIQEKGQRLRRNKIGPCLKQVALNIVKNPTFEHFSCSLDKRDYVGKKQSIPDRINPDGIRSLPLSRALSLLKTLGYIDLIKGSHLKLRTRFSPTQKMRDLLIQSGITQEQITQYQEILLVRDENKKFILYKETKKSLEMRSILTLVNEHNSKHEVLLNGEIINTDLIRIFRDSCEEKTGGGGRFYPRISKDTRHYQSLKKHERPHLMIDGEQVAEADFSAFLTSMVYASVGAEIPKDPYYLEFKGQVVDRDLIKVVMNRALNCDSRAKALESIKKAVDKTNFKWDGNLEKLLDSALEQHSDITDCFFKGNWFRGQYQESEIASLVMQAGVRDGVPVLCMHDAFIVPESKTEWIHDQMMWASKQILDVSLKVKIEPKASRQGKIAA